MDANKMKLALADDSKFSIDGLKAIISTYDDVEVTITANDGESLLNQLESTPIDIIILDYRMPPGKNGKELSKIIKDKYQETKILILSGYDDLKTIQGCLEAGVDGYLLKGEVGVNELREAINRLKEDDTFFSKTIFNIIVAHVSNKNDVLKKSSILTPTECKVLLLICQEYTTKEMAKKLFRSINTIEKHRKNILGKTRCKNSVGLALWAVKEGLLSGFQSS